MDISDEEFVKNAVKNAHMHFKRKTPLKLCVALVFKVTESVSILLCLRFRYNPDEMVDYVTPPTQSPHPPNSALVKRRAFLLFIAYADRIQTFEEATAYWENELSPYDRAEWVRRAAEYHSLLDQDGARS